MFSVYIRQAERTIDVEIGSTILETALALGIDYPHGCRAGNCGGCKSHLHSGEVELSPYSKFALSPFEYSDGLILACRAVPWSDCEVSWCELDDVAMHPVLNITGTVSKIEKLTEDIISIKVKIQENMPFEFSSGQFVYLNFVGYPRREYSMAGFQNGELEFYIRNIDGGLVSSFIWKYLSVGESLELEGPHGNMFYREQHEGPILAVAGGSGLSAVQPIVLEALKSQSDQSVYLYHGVRDEPDIFRSEIFESLQDKRTDFHYFPVLSEAKASQTEYKMGLLSAVLEADFRCDPGFKAYLAGPPPMVETCTEVLLKLGLDAMNIHADPFFTDADQVR